MLASKTMRACCTTLAVISTFATGTIASASPGREDCNNNGVPDLTDLADWGGRFTDPTSWASYDPGANGLGTDPDGFEGAVFDGRYLYFVPYRAEYPYFTGEVMRYDTTGPFDDLASWRTFTPTAHGIGYDPVGYAGGVFDGRFVYFVPWARTGNIYHGEVLCYDTDGDFEDPAAWAAFDPGANGVGVNPKGYRDGGFDGRYVYFAPCYNNTFGFHCEVLRFDTQGSFTDVASWAVSDPSTFLGSAVRGYTDAEFDGRYMYFGPYHTTNYHGRVLRYDTTGDFFAPASWTSYDPGAEGLGNDPDGFCGLVYDGRFVYFVPFNNGTTYSGEFMRYDTHGPFDDLSSWESFDAVQNWIGLNPAGFRSGVFDGRFAYFVPMSNSSGSHREVLRYDAHGDFTDPASWNSLILTDAPNGYRGGAFDGQYVYLAPGGTYTTHGEVQRYDTAAIGSPDCNGNGIPDECDLDSGFSEDCNGNGLPDSCDIACARSWDVNANGIPDECENGQCPADVNVDGTVDVLDLLAVLAAWGNTSGPEDINGDGIVNVLDLLEVLAAWGPCA